MAGPRGEVSAVSGDERPLSSGHEIEVDVEKPAAGGRMIARHNGRVLLVLGAVPGERVVARIERVDRRLAFASTVRVVRPSPDRRDVAFDARCGGCTYAHVAYTRQIEMKAQVVVDAFSRIGRIPLEQPVAVAASPERGSRMRARLHVRDGRLGFYREGTHEICDAAQTGHLLDDALRAASAALAALTAAGVSVAALELSENIAADQRAIHVEPTAGASVTPKALAEAARAAALTGCTALNADGRLVVAGTPWVSDPLPVLTRGRAGAGELERQPASFFQANRYLLPDLVVSVLDAVPTEGEVLDLYAGVGLFSVALAASGREGITAVEGDRASASDLQRNAARCGAVRVVIGSVEQHLASASRRRAAAIIVDPPRTGISKEAIEAIARQAAARVIYVSCDPPTMARDARRLLDAGYRLASLRAFDLFPNTPHVETLGVFTQEKGEEL